MFYVSEKIMLNPVGQWAYVNGKKRYSFLKKLGMF